MPWGFQAKVKWPKCPQWLLLLKFSPSTFPNSSLPSNHHPPLQPHPTSFRTPLAVLTPLLCSSHSFLQNLYFSFSTSLKFGPPPSHIFAGRRGLPLEKQNPQICFPLNSKFKSPIYIWNPCPFYFKSNYMNWFEELNDYYDFWTQSNIIIQSTITIDILYYLIIILEINVHKFFDDYNFW